MLRTIKTVSIVLAALASVPAHALIAPDMTRDRQALPVASELVDDAPTLAPLAFVKFCMNSAARCDQPAGASQISLNAERWQVLQTVNAIVNARIAPNQYKGAYDWSLETRYGNCNDYAVQKRQELIDRGFPVGALSLAAVITPMGEGHLILTVRTDRGDFVLDNLRQPIVAWNRTGYRWLSRQSAENPKFWVKVAGGRAPQIRMAAKAKPTPSPSAPLDIRPPLDRVPAQDRGLEVEAADTPVASAAEPASMADAFPLQLRSAFSVEQDDTLDAWQMRL